ncbi:aldo/keto reductase [Ornithinimicrobium panacihumi]|uniref:aldo/keto reductase n=1 Tax=Ornithinimicrobium panacihumi TaxID=2008449 RepID=UPI003F8882D2
MAASTIPQVTLSDGTQVPALGQGTWFIGDDQGRRTEEIDVLRLGIEHGMTLIDTAQMYGSGRSERLVGAAIQDCRDEVFLVDKVMPMNASRRGTIQACRQSLEDLGTDRIDLYLLHWRGGYPLEDTLAAFDDLQSEGLIRRWGVSNFDPADLGDLGATPAVNQILYNPSRRGPEFDLLPEHRRRGIVTMAYSPIEQGRLLGEADLEQVARRYEVSVAQVLLAWAIRDGGVIAIPKASRREHVLENAAAAQVQLSEDDLAVIDAAFPAPTAAEPLQML